MNSETYTEKIKTTATTLGADLVGIANANDLNMMKVYPMNLLRPFRNAVSIAVQLPVTIFDSISDRPTPIYNSTYQTANRILDEIAFKISIHLQKDGFKSLPIPASQTVDRKHWYGAISHKAVARMSGIGWQGKNLLLITPQYGPRVRLTTILTDASLIPDRPIKNRCGKCMECKNACPAEAIKGVNTEDHYTTRNEALYFSKCVEKLTEEFAQLPGIGTPICGLCIKVCPFGRKCKKKH